MSWTDREISNWLDEMLSAERMADFETELRNSSQLQSRVAQAIRNRDQGGFTVGEIWLRAGLSCPTRAELGGYLLSTLPADEADYVEFHLQTVGCRVCQANLSDLEEQSVQSDSKPRRRKFFESSAGLLRNEDDSAGFLPGNS
jgi:hypothetical protein